MVLQSPLRFGGQCISFSWLKGPLVLTPGYLLHHLLSLWRTVHSFMEAAELSQEQLSQVRHLLSAGSRSVQEAQTPKGSPTLSKKRWTPPPPPPPLSAALVAPQVEGGSSAKWRHGKTVGGLRGLLGTRLIQVPGEWGLSQSGLPPIAVEGSSPSPPPILPTLQEGWGRWVSLSGPTRLSVGSTDGHDDNRQLRFPVGSQLSFSPSLAVDNFRTVCPGGDLTDLFSLSLLWEVLLPCWGNLSRHRCRCCRWREGHCGKKLRPSLPRGTGGCTAAAGPGVFYSHHFLAINHTGGICPILNLSGLNTFTWRPSIIQGLHNGWWIVSLDWKDAYLHMPINPSHWLYVLFALMTVQGDLLVYHWRVLPFGPVDVLYTHTWTPFSMSSFLLSGVSHSRHQVSVTSLWGSLSTLWSSPLLPLRWCSM